MNNPCRKKTIFFVDYGDLNSYIAECLGVADFEGTLESPNDSAYEYNVTDKSSESDKSEVERIITEGDCEYWRLGLVLDYLCAKGFLEQGEYVVGVCW